jgi:hypothetical protein
MTDFISLLPHSKKDVKLDTKSDRSAHSSNSSGGGVVGSASDQV